MCGIAGVLKFNGAEAGPDTHATLRAMGAQIAHRGPDDEQLYCDGPLGVLFRRLSIVDLPGGRQPLFNEDGTLMLPLLENMARELPMAPAAVGPPEVLPAVLIEDWEAQKPQLALQLARRRADIRARRQTCCASRACSPLPGSAPCSRRGRRKSTTAP